MTHDDLRIADVRTFEELDKHADEWDLLALNAPWQHPVMTHAWISAYLKTSLKEGETWFCLFAFKKEELVGVLPLLVREYKLLLSKYLLLRTPNDAHTMSVDFLFKKEYGIKVIQLFVSYLNILRPRAIKLTMSKVGYNSPTINIIDEGIYGIYSYYYPSSYTSVIPVEGSFDAYKKRLSKKFIGNVRRSTNRLQKLGNFSITIIENRSDARENMLSFAEIEQSGWKGARGTAIKNRFWNFFEVLVRNMSEKGWLKWYFLNVENKRIAGWMSIPFGNSVIVLKTGYDEKYYSYSPGSVLTEKMIEHIFSTGKYKTINFLTDFKWISRWNVGLKPYYKIVFAFNNPLSFFSTRLPYIIYSKFTPVRRIRTYLYRAIQNIFRK